MAEIANSAVFFQNDNSNTTTTLPNLDGTRDPISLYDNAMRALLGAIAREHAWRNPTVTSGGTANAQTLTYAVTPAAYYAGQVFSFFVGVTNTAAMTLNVNGLGAKSIKRLVPGSAGPTYSDPLAGDLRLGTIAQVVYDGTRFVLVNDGLTLNDSQLDGMRYDWTVGGTANAITLTNTKGPTAYVDKMRVEFKVAATNTGATTINVNGAGAISLALPVGGGSTNNTAGLLVQFAQVSVIYDAGLNVFLLEEGTPLPSRSVVSAPSSVGTGTTYTIDTLVLPRNFSKLYVRFSGVSHDNASSRILQIQISSDGGSTWSTATNISPNIAAGSSVNGVVNVWGANVGSATRYFDSYATDGTNHLVNVGAHTTSDTTQVDAVRLLWNGAGNFDAGTAMLIGEM